MQQVAFVVYTVAPEKTPYGTHAYIVTDELAERLARQAGLMIERAKFNVSTRSTWQLDAHDIKIDHFILNYYVHLTTYHERPR